MTVAKPTHDGVVERISALERAYVEEVLEAEFATSAGARMCARLEAAFAERFGSRFAISFVNGTATMHAALAAAGIGPGDEVIVPPLTMASTTMVVLQAGATPVFADVDPETFQIDAASISERITERTRAIIPVALYGVGPDMDAIMALAGKHDLFVLEDSAEAMFSECNGRLVGAIGHMGSFSFQSSKHLTSGEGGMLITDDEELALAARRFSSLGYAGLDAKKGKITKDDIQDPGYARHASVGYNYRMAELCAAVALAQLERADVLVQRRIDVGRLFLEAVGNAGWLIPQQVPSGRTNSFWTFAARLDHPDASWQNFRDEFRTNGGDGIYGAWRLTYLEPMFQAACPMHGDACPGNHQRYAPGLCPHAERLQPRLLQFQTNYWDWSDAERQADALRKTIAAFT